MTRENAKKLLPIIKAFADGKEIECQNDYDDNWFSSEDFSFDKEPEKYRIKPELKYRPFESCDELIKFWESYYDNSNRPKGSMPLIWLKSKATHRIFPVLGFDQNDNTIKIQDWYNGIDLYKNFTFLDRTPCGIEVKE